MMPTKTDKQKSSGPAGDRGFWLETEQPEPEHYQKNYERAIAGREVRLCLSSKLLTEQVRVNRELMAIAYPDLPVAAMPVDKLLLLVQDFNQFLQEFAEEVMRVQRLSDG